MKKILIILTILISAVIDLSAKDFSVDAIEGIYTVRYRIFTSDHIVYLDEDSLYVPLSRVLDNLKIYYQITESGNQYEGYMGKPDSSFYFDFIDKKAKFVNRQIDINSKQFVIQKPEVYVTPNLIATLFDIDHHIYNADLTIFFRSFYDLPVYTEYKRRLLEANSNYLRDGYYDLLYGRDRKWIGGGILDYNTSLVHAQGDNRLNYSTNLGMEVLGGDLNLSNFGNYFQANEEFFNRTFFAWRFYVGDNPYLSQINVGDISSAGIRTNMLPNQAIRGVRISNEETQLPSQFTQYVIQDRTAPGTRVELYINNLFHTSIDADEYGNYRFDLPVYYGNTNIQLRFYGPDGEYDEKDLRFNIDNQFLKPGEVKYTASAGERELDQQFMADTRVSVGVTDWLTTTFGADNNLNKFNDPVFNENNFNYFNHTAIRLGGNIITSFDIYYEQLYKTNLRLFFNDVMTFNGSYTYYDGISIFNPTNIQERFDLNIGFPNIFGLPINLYGNAYRLNMENFNTTVLFSSMMLNLNPVFFNVRYFRNQNDYEGGRYLSQNLTTELTYSWNRKPRFLRFLKSTRFSLFTNYDLDFNQITQYGVALDQNLFKWASLRASYSISNIANFNQFRVNLIMNLPSFQSRTDASQMSNQSVISQSVSGTVGFDPDERAFHLNNPVFQNSVGQGAAKFRFFLDDNGNGNYDEGEKRIDHVKFSVENGQLERSLDNNAEIAYNLAPYGRFNVSVEPTSFENPLWIPKTTNFSFIADPNAYKPIDVPCYAGGVIEGSVIKKVGKLKEYQSGVKIHIMSEDSNYHETVPVFSDGTFYKMGVPPGEYKAWVDDKQLEILGMQQDGDFLVFNIEQTTYGDFASDIDFTLRYEGDVAKEDLAIDEDTKGLDEVEEDVESIDDLEAIEENAEDIASNDNIEELQKEIEDAQKLIADDTKPEEEKIQAITDIDKKYVIYFSGKQGVGITNNSQNTLDRIVQFMLNNDDYKLGLVGHTDNFSSMSDHLTVSRNRANKAKDYLVSKGISPDRIFARGVGALEPVESNATEEGRQLNRRVEIAIIK